MHWLLIAAQHHPDQGGIGAFIQRFVRLATSRGWTVDLVTRESSKHPDGARVHIIETDDESPTFESRIRPLRELERIRPYRYGLWSLAVARFLLDLPFQPDVIEFVDCQAEGFVALNTARVRARFPDVPMIVHAHTPMYLAESINQVDVSRFSRAIYHDWERRALEATDGVIASSRLMANQLKHRDCFIGPCPLDESIEPVSPRVARPPRIVFAGTIDRRKGVDVWLESLARVFRAVPDATAELIGADTSLGPGGTSFLDSLMHGLDPTVRARLHVLGALDHCDCLERIREAALFVLPSRFDSFGYAAAEAVQSSVPVVLSDHVGLREHVVAQEVVPAGDVESLADAQIRSLADADAARDFAAAARSALAESCRGDAILDARAAFVEGLRHRPCRARLRSDHDAMEEMVAFLRDVETRERELISAAGSSW